METREQKFKRLYPNVDQRLCMFPWADPEEYDAIQLPDDLAIVKDELVSEYIKPYNLPWLQGHVLKVLVDAIPLVDSERANAIEKARTQARNSHLADMATGRIRIKRDGAEPMPDDVKSLLRQLADKKKSERKERRSRIADIEAKTDKAKTKGVKDRTPATKIPIYQDISAQEAIRKKYPWASTFSPNPNKPGGTLVTIVCDCGKERVTHLSDLFHVKKCNNCK